MLLRISALTLCWGLILGNHPAFAADAPDLSALVGKTIDLQLQNGKQVSAAEVTKVVPGTEAGSIKSLVVKAGKPPRTQSIVASLVAEMYEGGQTLDIEFDRKKKTIVHSPERRAARERHEAEVQERLAAQRHRLWPELSQKEHEDWVVKHKEYLKEVSTKMPGVRMQLVETKYYLFYTDMPAETVGIYIAYLDLMYEELCRAFGIPAGKNIWCGKCVVIAFQEQTDFQAFEEIMFQKAGATAQGYCHGAYDGKVIISCFKGEADTFFANMLVHETSHGFIHRWMSSVHVPSWVNEGVADWVAATVVKDKEVQRRQKTAIDRIQQAGSLGGNFFEESHTIEPWQYGVASSLVELMLRIDPTKYRQFLTHIKEGLSSQEALQKAYGMTREELVKRYGSLAGVPNLQP
ncbi:MAG: hypothetical protein ACR2FY_19645 [Pirellulaceae bacterium]